MSNQRHCNNTLAKHDVIDSLGRLQNKRKKREKIENKMDNNIQIIKNVKAYQDENGTI